MPKKPPTTMTLATYIQIASTFIALVAVGIVVYKEFLAGSNLTSAISQVCLLRLPNDNKSILIREILLDDLLSETPTEQAQHILNVDQTVRAERLSGDRLRVATALDKHAREARITYDARPQDIVRYFPHGKFAATFYIPLLVTNSGRRTGVVSNLVLVIEDAADPKQHWAYTCFTEVDSKVLLDRRKESHDSDRVKSLFNGFAVAPGETIRVDPMFIPIADAKGKPISVRNLAAGAYRARVFMYSTGENPVCSTKSVEFKITAEMLIGCFQGSESLDNISVDGMIANAIDW